ncbi:MAG: dihydroxy-acid dehydratase [Candidatus Lokiarchaeota archaeon]|nr:dihydroxy-acid dehydratase [Candidatus Lokiarchaeota archaeon]
MNKSQQESDPKARSKEIFSLIKNTPFYYVTTGIMKGIGLEAKEIERKPLIGVVNTWNELNPGHKHLRYLAEGVKWGVLESGGIPLEFNTIAPCDGWANGNDGMRYILPQREIIADSIECMIQAHRLDAMVTLSSCDKINPAVLMAAIRLDIPTICVPGGPSLYDIHWIPQNEYKGIEQENYENFDTKVNCISCGTCGACEQMGTANTFQCLMEAFGMTLPNAATIPAVTQQKYIIAKQSGKQILTLLEKNIIPSKIMTQKSLENVIKVDLAIGGSTNSAIHLPAIAHEMGIDFNLDWFNDYSKIIPTIVNVSPTGSYGISDLYKAGGISAVLKRLESHLNLDCLTVSGKTLKKVIKKVEILDPNVIHPLENPVFPEGGTVILKGNLAPEGAVIKQSAIRKTNLLKFSGKAIVFNSEKDAIEALLQDKIKNGNVVVIRYEGPKGGPGMPELLAFTASLMLYKGLQDIALISDGRFSGATWGPCIGHVCPEAYEGGLIAVVQEGDPIDIDIPKRKLHLNVSEREIENRFNDWKRIERDIKSSTLLKYRKLVSSASEGAVLRF